MQYYVEANTCVKRKDVQDPHSFISRFYCIVEYQHDGVIRRCEHQVLYVGFLETKYRLLLCHRPDMNYNSMALCPRMAGEHSVFPRTRKVCCYWPSILDGNSSLCRLWDVDIHDHN